MTPFLLSVFLLLPGADPAPTAPVIPAPTPAAPVVPSVSIVPVVSAPSSLSVVTGTTGQIKLTTTGKKLKVINPNPSLELFREYTATEDGSVMTYRVVPKQAGVYQVHFYTAAKDEPSEPLTFTVNATSPEPPPAPAPLPPGPTPPPAPTPPTPDAFTASVQTAYAAEAAPAKANQAALLAALYRTASDSTVNDQSLATVADLMTKVSGARKTLLPDTALVGVRAAIGAELNKTLSTPANLDTAKRAEVAGTLGKVATALEGLK